jgi:hypothetical protein
MNIGIAMGIPFANVKPLDIVRAGLLADYRFDESVTETLTDYSGNGKSAQLGSAAGVDSNDPLPNGQYYQFMTDDYIKTPIQFVTFPYSVDFVVSFGNPSKEGGCLIGTGLTHAIMFTAGRYLNFTSTVDYRKGIHTSQFAPNQFYHITVVYRDIRDLSIYKDGVDVTSDGDDYWTSATTTFEIGSRNSGASRIGSAQFAYVLPYSKALSSAEVAQNHSYLKNKLTQRGILLA